MIRSNYTATVLLMFLLGACGTHDKGDSPSSDKSTENKGIDPAAQPGVSTSYYVAKESDLKDCNNDTLGYLAYVKEDEEFKACFKEGWQTVEIKGKDGKDGSNGKDGAQGIAGTSGKDGSSVVPNDNIWTDPITGKKWLIGATTGPDVPYNTGCPSGYSLGTADEALAATVHGLGSAANRLNGTSMIWAQKLDPLHIEFITSDPKIWQLPDGQTNALNTRAVLACYKL